MKKLMIVETFNPRNRGVEWYDGETGEFLREYGQINLVANGPYIQQEFEKLRAIKIPSTLEESKLWC